MATLLKGIPQEFKNIDQPNADVKQRYRHMKLSAEHWKQRKQRMQNEDDALKAIQARTTIVKQQKADSFAYYEVVKRNPLQLKWIPYCDKWTADPEWIRGLRISDVERQEQWTMAFDSAIKKEIAEEVS